MSGMVDWGGDVYVFADCYCWLHLPHSYCVYSFSLHYFTLHALALSLDPTRPAELFTYNPAQEILNKTNPSRRHDTF